MTDRANNFPPLPRFIPLKPCFYQDIEEEIPAQHHLLVRRVYYLWILYSATLVVNVVACVAWWAGGGNGANFGLSLVWLLLFSPCSYVCWFRPLYKAFRGWLSAVLFFSSNVGSAVVMLMSAILFTVVALLMSVALIRVHRLYRGGGGSLQRAQEEWSSGAWKNAPVRDAGFHAISGSGPSLPEYPTVPSYPDNSQW
ncbi:secretory carrier-associated membrane protein 4 isoform X2 [Lepisosteus oculatus]|uniref:Secretory carrier-associated membrane protein n=1 Tax=Lepisosteus oculatus TaxID=7918 RepID=W5MHP7_LEPOC|nr:PREDICTED: secretory carrier-associated membrane protein 4 [Lepisosteus oculatus]XP_015220736.1 PREDICTED: secretory carrier-associated membrane protein 4 [Lepisosteus oculatus]XP_015220737.1 PREDICTED: secretory carrier-associated membrane protein 4 [Lepisosteus oculatus]